MPRNAEKRSGFLYQNRKQTGMGMKVQTLLFAKTVKKFAQDENEGNNSFICLQKQMHRKQNDERSATQGTMPEEPNASPLIA